MPDRIPSRRMNTALATLAAVALIALPVVSRADSSSSKAKEKQELADVLSQLHQSDSTEIALGRLAEEKGSATVQAYGKMLVSDHDQADREIASLAQQEGVELAPPAPENSMEQAQDARADVIKADLKKATGDEFDRKFLETMVNEHAHNIKMVEKQLNESGDDNVRKLFGDVLTKLEEHHDKAEHLLKKEMGQTTTPGAPGFMPMKPAI